MEWIRAVDEVSSNLMIREDTKVLFLNDFVPPMMSPLHLNTSIFVYLGYVITESKLQTAYLGKFLKQKPMSYGLGCQIR
jgi:hypothetical protein